MVPARRGPRIPPPDFLPWPRGGRLLCALCLAAAVRPFSDFADVHDDDDDDGLTEERWKECWPSSHARSLNLILVDLAIFAVFHKGPAPRVWNKLYAREKNLSYLKFEHFCNTKFDRI